MNVMDVSTVRQVRLLRQVGGQAPHQYQWGCRIHSTPDRLDVRIAAPCELGSEPAEFDDDAGFDEPDRRLHERLLWRIPSVLRSATRSEIGVIMAITQVSGRPPSTRRQSYVLATCADVVLTLAASPSPVIVTPWLGTCLASDVNPELPVVLGPSAVLSLTGGVLEMPDHAGRAVPTGKAVPDWMSVRCTPNSPYPPHDMPPGLEDVPDEQRDAISYWATRTEHWMRPMRTTRASRGQYQVNTALPPTPAGRALWVEALTSLDARGRYWQASLSLAASDGRRWLTQPWPVQVRAGELLAAAIGQAGPPQPALDRDPVDGESFGWAPTLLTGCTADLLSRRRYRNGDGR